MSQYENRIVVFVQSDDVFSPLSMALSFTTLYNESCVIIFAFRAMLSHFLAFLQFYLCTSIPGMSPDIFCVHSQSLKAVFALSSIKVFCPTKFIWHNSQWKHMTHEHLRSNQMEDGTEVLMAWEFVSDSCICSISPPFLF